eukprot:UN02487
MENSGLLNEETELDIPKVGEFTGGNDIALFFKRGSNFIKSHSKPEVKKVDDSWESEDDNENKNIINQFIQRRKTGEILSLFDLNEKTIKMIPKITNISYENSVLRFEQTNSISLYDHRESFSFKIKLIYNEQTDYFQNR